MIQHTLPTGSPADGQIAPAQALYEAERQVEYLHREIALRDLTWQEWFAVQHETGHKRDSSDDGNEEWCDTCATPDADSPAWPCAALLANLGLPDARAYNRVEIAQSLKETGDQLGSLLVDEVTPDRDRFKSALETIAAHADDPRYVRFITDEMLGRVTRGCPSDREMNAMYEQGHGSVAVAKHFGVTDRDVVEARRRELAVRRAGQLARLPFWTRWSGGWFTRSRPPGEAANAVLPPITRRASR